MLALSITLVLLLLLAIGTPVGFAMLIAGVSGLYLVGGGAIVETFLRTTSLSVVSSYELLTVPMFVLMAEILVVSRVADDMFEAVQSWVGRQRGGLATATAITGALFGAISGSSTAGAATLSATSLPAMLRHGYDRNLACGVVVISGTLAMLIPPSIALIVYAILANQSVGKLLVAGVVPGILVTLTIILTIQFLAWREPGAVPQGPLLTLREKLQASRGIWPFLILFLCVTGSIYGGIATPTEAAGLGAFGAFVIAIARGMLSIRQLLAALGGTARTTAMIYLIIIGAQVFGYFLTLSQATQGLLQITSDANLPVAVMLLLIAVTYLVLGCFMDQLAILILTIPIMLPVIVGMGYDPIWFGVIVVLLAEVGMVTPPVGMNVFVVARATGIPAAQIFKGAGPHVVAHLILITLMIIFPEIVMWLPNTM